MVSWICVVSIALNKFCPCICWLGYKRHNCKSFYKLLKGFVIFYFILFSEVHTYFLKPQIASLLMDVVILVLSSLSSDGNISYIIT